ncbi:hypothetical protein HAX54_002202, partial [Datura stramonium]|nr:hypothetical protein [Datura stramonium]
MPLKESACLVNNNVYFKTQGEESHRDPWRLQPRINQYSLGRVPRPTPGTTTFSHNALVGLFLPRPYKGNKEKVRLDLQIIIRVVGARNNFINILLRRRFFLSQISLDIRNRRGKTRRSGRYNVEWA